MNKLEDNRILIIVKAVEKCFLLEVKLKPGLERCLFCILAYL
jgi:hypothetical protein